MDTAKSLVLFSGGQDSTTCLAWALSRYHRVETIGFDYGQRHAIELSCRQTILTSIRQRFPQWGERLGDDHLINLQTLGQISDTALTREQAIAYSHQGLPNTFVPGRNILFLSFAAALAYRRGIDRLVAGMCQTDSSGYPDCRDDAIKALQVALNCGMASRFCIETPLMWLNKGDIWHLAQSLGGVDFLDLVRHETHTCYLGERREQHDWGWGCGTCPACRLRADGYAAFLASP